MPPERRKIVILSKIRVGKYDYKAKKQANTKGYKNLLVHTTSPFSPYVLRTEDNNIIENRYQFSKVWKKVYKQNQIYNRFKGTKGWNYREEVHVDEKGNITDEYWKWRKRGMSFHLPVRRPNGYKDNEVQFSLILDPEGDILDPKGNRYRKLDLIEARKLIYFKEYMTSVKKTEEFKKLKKRLTEEEDFKLQINEVDMCDHMDKYPYNQVYKESIHITKSTIKALFNSSNFPFCHSYCLAMLLIGKEEWISI